MSAPTDRSMPAVSTTYVMPVAAMSNTLAWIRTLMRLAPVRNLGCARAKTTISIKPTESSG